MLIQLYYLAEKKKNMNDFVIYIEYEIKKFLLCSNNKSNVLLITYLHLIPVTIRLKLRAPQKSARRCVS